MKSRALVRLLKKNGCVLVRHGSNHDWYQNELTKARQPVPRHVEVDEHLAKHIIKILVG